MTGDYGVAHGFGHEGGVGGFGDGGVHEEAVGAEFHGDSGVGGGAHTSIDDHRDFGDAFAEDAKIGGILDAEAGADGRGQRHDGGGSRIDKFACGDQVVIRVRKNDEAFFYEDARGFDQLLGVGEKSLLVADDFQLDPVGEADLAGETSGANGFVGAVTSGGVRQDEHFFAVDKIEKRFFGAVGEIHAADGDGHHVCARGGVSARHFREAAVLACPHNQAGFEGAAGYDEFIGHW